MTLIGARKAWGIVDVKGDRRLARRISFTMPGEEVQYVNLVFDYG